MSLFGTDGVRGIANQELTPEMAYRLGRCGAFVLSLAASDLDIENPEALSGEAANRRSQGVQGGLVLIGRDTRRSGDMLASALKAGISSVGAHAVDLGVVPTPAVAYLVKQFDAVAGTVISASHNPALYNGIKFFDHQGYKLSAQQEAVIESIFEDDEFLLPRPVGADVGRITAEPKARRSYEEYITATVAGDGQQDFGGDEEPAPASFEQFKVVIDCANGATYQTAPEVFESLDLDLRVTAASPNGVNINDDCGSVHPGNLVDEVLTSGADVGFAFDGDGDRVIAVDADGNVVDGDRILAICGLDLLQRQRLTSSTVVATVLSNYGLEVTLEEAGAQVVRTPVGDRNVLAEMLRGGFALGGEQSGHVIFGDLSTTGDGLLTAVQLLDVMARSGRPLAELASVLKPLPQVQVNVAVDNAIKKEVASSQGLAQAVEHEQKELAGRGRVLVRPSGTEPVIRIMVESRSEREANKVASRLQAEVEEQVTSRLQKVEQ